MNVKELIQILIANSNFPNAQVATLQDYIQDIQSWLPDYFYSKFMREILHRLTGTDEWTGEWEREREKEREMQRCREKGREREMVGRREREKVREREKQRIRERERQRDRETVFFLGLQYYPFSVRSWLHCFLFVHSLLTVLLYLFV